MSIKEAKRARGFRKRSPFCCANCKSFVVLRDKTQLCKLADIQVGKVSYCDDFKAINAAALTCR